MDEGRIMQGDKCKLNTTCAERRHLLSKIKEKFIEMSESNIGFCYVYFDLREDQDEFPAFVKKYLKDIRGNKEF
jgi:hypothetical protein